jgi:hypothetical protein
MPMMFMQTTKGALPKCSIKEKGKEMTKLAQGLNKYEYTYTYIQIDRHCLYVPCVADLIFIAFSVKLLFNIREKDLVDEMEGAGRRRVADPSRGCLKREEERGREEGRYFRLKALYSHIDSQRKAT